MDQQKSVRLIEAFRDFAATYLDHLSHDDRLTKGADAYSVAAFRHARHYLNVTITAYSQFDSGDAGVASGLAVFDLDWPNIRVGGRWAVSELERYQSAALLVSMYADTAGPLMHVRGTPERLAWHEAAVRASRRLGLDFLEPYHVGSAADAATGSQKFSGTLEINEQLLQRARRDSSDLVMEGNALGSIGRMYARRGDYDRALDYFAQALGAHDKAGEVRGQILDEINIARVHIQRADLQTAKTILEHVLGVAVKTGDVIEQAKAKVLLAQVGVELKDYPPAVKHYREALTIGRELKYARIEEDALDGLAEMYERTGQYADAIGILEELASKAAKRHDRTAQVRIMARLAPGYVESGAIDRGIEMYISAIGMNAPSPDVLVEARLADALAGLYRDSGQWAQAVEWYERALPIYVNANDRQAEAILLNNLGPAYGQIGDVPKAFATLERAIHLAQDVGDQFTEAYALFGRGWFLGRLGDTVRAFHDLRSAALLFRDIDTTTARSHLQILLDKLPVLAFVLDHHAM